MIGIYKITNPKGKIYIGQSSNIERRMIEHKYRSKTKNLKLYSSLRKYGIDNHKIDILFLSKDKYEKDRMESIYIKYEQIKKLGGNVYLYVGGLFEWLLLQDIYGNDHFQTTNDSVDLLKYKPPNVLNTKYLTY